MRLPHFLASLQSSDAGAGAKLVVATMPDAQADRLREKP
jgi:hypothetical protein